MAKEDCLLTHSNPTVVEATEVYVQALASLIKGVKPEVHLLPLLDKLTPQFLALRVRLSPYLFSGRPGGSRAECFVFSHPRHSSTSSTSTDTSPANERSVHRRRQALGRLLGCSAPERILRTRACDRLRQWARGRRRTWRRHRHQWMHRRCDAWGMLRCRRSASRVDHCC